MAKDVSKHIRNVTYNGEAKVTTSKSHGYEDSDPVALKKELNIIAGICLIIGDMIGIQLS